MLNRKFKYLIAMLALVLPLVLVACGAEEAAEQAVGAAQNAAETAAETAAEVAETAADTASEAADTAAETAETVVEEVKEVVEEVVAEEPAEEEVMEEAAEEEMAEEEMAEEVMEEEAHDDSMMMVDEAVYGNIDDIIASGELDGTVVKWWHNHSRGREEYLLGIIDEFNATNEYGIVVEATNEGGYGDIYDKMIAGITTGEVPGLVVAYQNQAAAYQVADGLISLDPYKAHPVVGLSEDEQADFFPAFLNADRLPQFGGESFGWPPNRSMEVMYYNVDWLAELGYDAPPQTPAEFVEMSCAASANPFSGNSDPSQSVGYAIRTDASNVASMAFAAGADIYDYENNAFTYNTPELAAYMTAMAGVQNEGCGEVPAERYGEQPDFGNGQVLFTMGSSSGIPFYQGSIDDGTTTDGFAWSTAAIPYTGAEPSMNIYGASVSIPASDPVTQLASFIFIKYFTGADVQAGWVTASNYFPVRASVADGITDYVAENPGFGAAFDMLQYGKTEPPVAGYDNVRDEAAAAYSRVLDGEDAATVLAELDEVANELLADSAP